MKKRLLSTIAASTLVAAQVAMPVMAADGTITVGVTDKEAVIRVEVPTVLEISVDQFETVDKGTQIYSEPFTMVNKSVVPVNVSVTSTATVPNATLVSKVSDVNPATPSANGTAWLAVAAKTSSEKYIEESGKDIGDLTEASGNVETFDAASKAASQDFYLAKGSGNASYKLLDKDTATEVPSYAKYYELTAATVATDAALQTLVDAGDVYYEATTGAGTDGNVLTRIAKGTKNNTKDANSTYYTVATSATAGTALAANKKYVYGEMSTAGDSTAFRYIGKLEDAKANWSKTDISSVKIEYDINGVTASNYDEAQKYCSFGLYSEPGTDMTAGTAKGTVQYVTADVSKVVSINMTNKTGTYDAMVDFKTIYAKATSAVSGGNTVITFDPKYSAFYSGDVDATIVYVDKNGKQKTQVLTLDMDL